MSKEIKTPAEVIAALGGVGKVSALTGCSYQRVWNWRKRGFPSTTHAILTGALNALQLSADPSLWRQVRP